MSSGKNEDTRKLLRRLPSVERLLERDTFVSLTEVYGRRELVAATRSVLAEIRKAVQEGRIEDHELPGMVDSWLNPFTSSSLGP